MSEFSFAASTAALMTTMSLLIAFVALFSLLVMSVIDGFHENSTYDQDHAKDLFKGRRPLRILPQPA